MFSPQCWAVMNSVPVQRGAELVAAVTKVSLKNRKKRPPATVWHPLRSSGVDRPLAKREARTPLHFRNKRSFRCLGPWLSG